MAVQAYHVLHTMYPRGIFSYLDADTLSLIIEAPGLPTQQVLVGQTVQVDFDTLFALHGYELSVQRPLAIPPALRQALVTVYSTREGFKQGRAWLQTFGQGNPQMPTEDKYPALTPLISEFETLCGDNLPTPTQVAAQLGCNNSQLVSCAKLFIADWLEEYVFETLRELASDLGLHQVGMGLEFERPSQRELELDAAAMLNYQLFAISCMVTDRPQSAKDHLMETFVRARQLGGDEARFALVCCIENAAMTEQEVSQSWDVEGKIRVFGREHLPNLAQHFREWITTAGQLR